jgi:hypothetical protein
MTRTVCRRTAFGPKAGLLKAKKTDRKRIKLHQIQENDDDDDDVCMYVCMYVCIFHTSNLVVKLASTMSFSATPALEVEQDSHLVTLLSSGVHLPNW